MTWLLPPGVEEGAVLALLGVSFGASFITAAFGIGGGLILIAVMAMLMPPAALIPIHGIVQIGSNLGRTLVLIRYVDWSLMPGFILGAAIGAGLGGSVAVNIPESAVLIGVGLFVIWSVLSKPPPLFRRYIALTGGVSTFLTMFFGATGPFVASYIRALKLGRERHLATHSALMTMQHMLKVVAFGILGFAFGPWLGFIAAMIGLGFVGTVLGRQVLRKIDDARFYRVLSAILLLLALRLIWQGASIALAG